MNPLILDQHRGLFKDSASYEAFIQILTEGLGHDLSPIMSDQHVLGAVLSAEATKEMLYERVIKRLSQRPELFDEIKSRIENDEIVD